MKRRDFVKLFTAAPAAIGAASVLSNIQAAEPVIDILVPNKELILPKESDSFLTHIHDTLFVNKIISFNLTASKYISTMQHTRESVHIRLDAFMYPELIAKLTGNTIKYFQTNFDELYTDTKNLGLHEINGMTFVMTNYEINIDIQDPAVVLEGVMVSS